MERQWSERHWRTAAAVVKRTFRRLTKIHLGVAGSMNQRYKYLTGPPLLLTHVIRDNGNPAGEPVLIAQLLEDPLGSVALLLDDPFVVFQDLIDN